MAEFEQEKFEMQKQHTQNIQELLDETNQRLQKMETEYNQQNATTVSTAVSVTREGVRDRPVDRLFIVQATKSTVRGNLGAFRTLMCYLETTTSIGLEKIEVLYIQEEVMARYFSH